jgi:hypothetical protein
MHPCIESPLWRVSESVTAAEMLEAGGEDHAIEQQVGRYSWRG